MQLLYMVLFFLELPFAYVILTGEGGVPQEGLNFFAYPVPFSTFRIPLGNMSSTDSIMHE